MYSDRFNHFMPFILEWETVFKKGHYGDYIYAISENEDGDPGGLTKFGIDQRSHPKIDINKLTKESAIEIYWNSYWQKNKCESYAEKLGECVMNCCVNAGWGRAKLILQKAKSADEFIKEQENFYRRLVAAKPKSKKFLQGWLNRTAAMRRFLKL